ncbi:murein biosynthesis integral membrane protein MurJ [Pararhodobacter sp. SW119]|uniref:murein biosynthesis integral membrane protein MurJ n=1 Tax=Pararhodobacter sp. SW119 TaxID=2780075 RepID=UPI001ADECD25|nr:murein biosynthesis integral membrane protein MurJ [Pararhodobacter sp. SW119]
MTPIRLMRSFATVGGWTLFSRLLGFVRDVLMARFLGAGTVADAFFVAFSLPNMFRRFFAEGAFNAAFVPMFTKRLESSKTEAEDFARDAFWLMASFLIVFSVAAMAAMPLLVWAMAAGFGTGERFELAVVFGRIAFPYILFVSLMALISGMLNATGRFIAAAAAPALLNVAFIAALLLGARQGWPIGLTLSSAVPVAGVLQLAAVWWALRRAGFRLRFRRPRLTPELKRLLIIAAPAILAGGVVQVNLIVGRQVASFTENAISWLSYADRLYQLPLGVVGIAVGVVLLPELSRRLRAGEEAGARDALSRGMEFALALTVPSAVALVVIAQPIVSVLFERGAFGRMDAVNTALALAIYGAGLPAFVLHKVLQPLYFAREDTRSPFRYALNSMVVNAVVAVGLMPVIGFVAAALGTTLAGWTMVWQLWHGSRPMGPAARPDARFRDRIWRIALSAAAMGVALWLLAAALEPMLYGPGRALALLALVLGGTVVYFGLGIAIGAFRPADLRAAMRRGSG